MKTQSVSLTRALHINPLLCLLVFAVGIVERVAFEVDLVFGLMASLALIVLLWAYSSRAHKSDTAVLVLCSVPLVTAVLLFSMPQRLISTRRALCSTRHFSM